MAEVVGVASQSLNPAAPDGKTLTTSDTLANDATTLFYSGRTIYAGGDAAIAAPTALARLTGLGKSLEIETV
jgi:hypothetical protein